MISPSMPPLWPHSSSSWSPAAASGQAQPANYWRTRDAGYRGPTPQGTMQVRSDITKQKAWPKNGRALSNVLRRLAPTLRAVGVGVTLDTRTGKHGSRMIQLNTLPVGSLPGQAGGTAGQGRVSGTI